MPEIIHELPDVASRGFRVGRLYRGSTPRLEARRCKELSSFPCALVLKLKHELKHELCKQRSAGYLAAMSATEILNELPKLGEADGRAIRQLPLELAEKNGDVAACNQAALDGAMMLDRMEDEDARRQSR
jgi:hypothetical protein